MHPALVCYPVLTADAVPRGLPGRAAKAGRRFPCARTRRIEDSHPDEHHVPTRRTRERPRRPAAVDLNTLKGSAGSLVEWYDVYVYSVFAVYFESQFFSPDDKNSTMYVWAIFAATFLMRPIGAWFFGRFADRHGRRLALTVSVTLMALCSFLIAITPTAASIGIWAAVILLFARLLQGFATGGEYGASATYMSEAAIPGRRGFLSSFHYVTLVGGHVLAQLTLLLMLTFWGKPEISEWGWRIAFGIGGIAAVVVFWLRRGMDESLSESSIEAAREGKAQKSGSMYELFVHQWRPLLLCFLITAGGTVAFYTYSVNGPKMIQSAFAGNDPMTGTLINLGVLAFLMVLQPVGAGCRTSSAARPCWCSSVSAAWCTAGT